jgi:ABC-type Na+ efflux pump permease subunit
MQTVYDWVTLAAFAGLIVLFLQRSNMDDPPDRILHYLPPALGCAVANYFGNEGYPVVAVGVLVALAAYTILVLKLRIGR